MDINEYDRVEEERRAMEQLEAEERYEKSKAFGQAFLVDIFSR